MNASTFSFLTSDPGEAGRYIYGYTHGKCRFKVDDSDRFGDFSCREAKLGNSIVRRLRWTGSGTCETLSERTPENQILLHIPLAGEFTATYGRRHVSVGAGSGLLLGAAGLVRREWHGNNELLNIFVDRRSLEAIAGQTYRIDPHRESEVPGIAVAEPRSMTAVLRFVDYVWAEMADGISPLASGIVSAECERLLLLLLLGAFSKDFNQQLRTPDPSPVPYYVARVRAYIHRAAGEEIALEDLVDASGVSARSLHYGFKRYLNTTPMHYLKMVRLDLARAALIAARTDGRKISDIVTAVGYSCLSRFSQDYRARFNEAPSHTRRYRE